MHVIGKKGLLCYGTFHDECPSFRNNRIVYVTKQRETLQEWTSQ